ncbi:MAG: hypothetical protein LBG46_06915 [Elusimicrobiota bacterium]|jgi:hypothetical protein|nr:hypothetical protein [Elusimicrobiota bacterium]
MDGKIFAIECKVSTETRLSKGNYFAIEDIAPKHTFVVAMSAEESYPLKQGIDVVPLGELKNKL